MRIWWRRDHSLYQVDEHDDDADDCDDHAQV